MSQVELDREEKAALKRAKLGYVRNDGGVWGIDYWAPLRIYRDSLSNIPASAVQLTFDRVEELLLVEVQDDGTVELTPAGVTALAHGVASE